MHLTFTNLIGDDLPGLYNNEYQLAFGNAEAWLEVKENREFLDPSRSQIKLAVLDEVHVIPSWYVCKILMNFSSLILSHPDVDGPTQATPNVHESVRLGNMREFLTCRRPPTYCGVPGSPCLLKQVQCGL